MYDKNIIQSIRILPSDKVTFPTVEEFKKFMEHTMPERGGYYYFPSSMMQCPPNTLVLFQYDNMIRATGMLIDSAKTDCVDENGESSGGYYLFDIETLHYLNTCIDKELLKKYVPSFKSFSQAKQKIDLDYFDGIMNMLSEADSYYEIAKDDINTPIAPGMLETNNGVVNVTCPRCRYIFEKSKRCPECGQMIKY